MNRMDFEEAVASYDVDLDRLHLFYKNEYDNSERQEIFRLCRKISRARIPSNLESREKVQEEDLTRNFISSLHVLENPRVLEYFSDKANNIILVRDPKIRRQDSQLEYVIIPNHPTKFIVKMTKAPLNVSEQMGFAHEIGHIPETDFPRDSYLEYSEALPMFMEYLIARQRHPDKQEALDFFLQERLPIEQQEAKDMMKIFKRTESKNLAVRMYHTQLFADYYKFLESLEFVIQLVGRMDSDLKAVSSEIEAVVNGQSLITTGENLDITTDGCPTLLKEYKRMSR